MLLSPTVQSELSLNITCTRVTDWKMDNLPDSASQDFELTVRRDAPHGRTFSADASGVPGFKRLGLMMGDPPSGGEIIFSSTPEDLSLSMEANSPPYIMALIDLTHRNRHVVLGFLPVNNRLPVEELLGLVHGLPRVRLPLAADNSLYFLNRLLLRMNIVCIGDVLADSPLPQQRFKTAPQLKTRAPDLYAALLHLLQPPARS